MSQKNALDQEIRFTWPFLDGGAGDDTRLA